MSCLHCNTSETLLGVMLSKYMDKGVEKEQFFIGKRCKRCSRPLSRDSEYYDTFNEAADALNSGNYEAREDIRHRKPVAAVEEESQSDI